MSGEIHMVPTSAIAATNAIKTGKVKALVAMGLKRIPALPDLPTITEQGLEGFKITNRYNLWLPAKSPSKIILAINKIVSDGMNSSQMAQKLLADGSQPGERMTPSELKKTILIEYAEIEQQVKNLSVKLQ
jgi:tripartite-type tricarboxylate transporter receptor subunit TctC